MYGSVDLISAEEFAQTYGTRKAYLAQVARVYAAQIQADYLSKYGAAYFQKVANQLMDRIGMPAAV